MRTRRLRFASALLAAAAVLTSAATATAAPLREIAGDAAARDAGRGDARSWKVVGGADVSDGAWPWVAAIAAASVADPFQATFCTGTVIHPRAVLTAAHCVTPPGSSTPYTASLIDVMTGKTDLYATTGQRIHAQQIAVHPSWLGGIGSPGDAAIVILSEPTAAPSLAIATPLDALTLARPGDTALIAGYGAVDGAGTIFPTRLQAAALPIQDDALCSAIWGLDYLPGAQLCAGWELADAAACRGDSGGPLIGQRSDGTWAQLGITSWGPGICDAIEAPGAWTDVGVVAGWITGVLRSAFAPPPAPLPLGPTPQPITPPAPPLTPPPVTAPAPATPVRAGPVRIHVEGFRSAAPPNGAAIPRAAARSGGRLSACRQKRAVTVIFSYANLLDADRVRVRWYRNGRPYFLGAALAPDGSDGRAFRSLSPAPNGR